jgi:hypothetical protein
MIILQELLTVMSNLYIETDGIFFDCLAAAGYKGRISIEGRTDNLQKDGSTALELLRSLTRRNVK